MRRNKAPEAKGISEQEAEIIKKIGSNKTSEKTFYDGIFINDDGVQVELLAFYTYRGEVCILDRGMDVNFSSYSTANKNIIHSAIMNNKYK
jgi:hypothetical protein